jgi:hypothetical protein
LGHFFIDSPQEKYCSCHKQRVAASQFLDFSFATPLRRFFQVMGNPDAFDNQSDKWPS